MEAVLASTISAGAGAEVRVLGPIEVSGPAGRARFTGNRQPALVGLLALSAPELLPRARLIDGLWGDDPPRTAIKTLHSHIARVRAALEACGLPDVLITREPGYLLAVPPDAVDVHRFERAAREARDALAIGADASAVHRLRDALALWRGDAFADAEPFGWASADIARLNDVRLGALGDLWEGELRLGGHVAAAGELDRLLVAHPIHERFVRLAMLALYRSDRHSDALTAYRRFRERLADELGTEPGPELARLHVQILRRDPVLDRGTPPPARAPVRRADARPLPAELPAPVNHFTGRTGELAALDGYCTPAGPRVLVVSGPAGMGKTALAVAWGHRAAPRFADGQIFIDMRGVDADAALSPSEALGHVLASLDQPDAAIPADLAGRAALYRSVTRDRHVLVTVDNVARIDQVLPLVPASTTSLLVVTSRSRLMALGTYHQVGAVELDALRDDEAIDLLGAVLGRDRIAREPAGAARLADLCDRMPLALQIAAAKLASRPHKEIGDLATELSTDRRLDGLSVEGDARSVRTVFATAYDVLAPETALVFRSIGLHTGRTCTAHLAAAAADIPLDAARKAMDELSAAHLVTEVARDRYQFHDLIRLYAAERAGSGRAAVLDRIIDWYLAAAAGANRIVDRGRDRVQVVLRDPPYELPFHADPVQALEFLDRERDTILPLMAYAIGHGRPEVAWQITYLLTGFFNSRGRWAQRVAMCRLGITGAVAAGDVVAEGLMRSGLGVAHLMTQRVDDALDEFGVALDRMRRGGDRQGEAHVHNNIAVAYAGLRRYDDAVAAYRQALDLHSAVGSPLGVALSLNNLGDAYVKMGRADLGLDYLTQALAAVRAIDNIRLEAAALSGLGQAHRQQRSWDAAVAYFTEALALRRETGDRSNEADTLNHLGRTEFDRGRDPVAADHFHRAEALSREIDDPNQEAIALAYLGRIHLRAARHREAGDYLRLAAAARELAPDPHEEAAIRRELAEAEESGGVSSGRPAE